MSTDVTLRAVAPSDEAFLLRLYGTTRPEVGMFGWDAAEQQTFIRMQYDMQSRSYAMQYPNAEQSIIVYLGQASGRIIVDRAADRISLTEIAVLPEFRGRGIATAIIERLKSEATRTAKPIDLSVERMNSGAFQLYRKSGFEVTGETDVYLAMRWMPPKRKPSRTT